MDKKLITVTYQIIEDDKYQRENRENLEMIRSYLEDVGVSLELFTGDRLSIMLHVNTYNAFKRRNAGRHRKDILIPREVRDRFGHSVCRYSDIVWLEQSKTDREICKYLKIPTATFSRHKKRLLESGYYKSLDRNRLSDKEYLESRPGDFRF